MNVAVLADMHLKKGVTLWLRLLKYLVPKAGLEPARL